MNFLLFENLYPLKLLKLPSGMSQQYFMKNKTIITSLANKS